MKKQIIKTRKSQYYLFGAIIFITAVFVIYTSSSGIVVKMLDVAQNYKANYIYEGLNVINNAIYEKTNISESMRNYTESFLSYADSNNEELGMVFIFSRDGRLFVNNYIKEPIIIDGETELSYSQEGQVDFEERIGIRYNNETYYQYFYLPDKTELKVLLVETQ